MLQTILNQLTGKKLVDALVQVMVDNFEELGKEKIQFEGVMLALQEKMKDGDSPSVNDEIEAIQQQMASDFLFSAWLGLKANLDHFIDPIARNFMDVDAETYLREDVAHSLPRYKEAQCIRNRFYALLTPEHQELYEFVIAYITHLETVGPKLAHYYGFLLGNQLFPLIIPGYVSDLALTCQYHMMLEKYFGKKIKFRTV